MKYVSPQTEKRRQQRQKRRKQQMLICAVLLALIVVITAVTLILGSGKDKPSSSQDSHSDIVSSENISSEEISSEESSSDETSSEDAASEPDDGTASDSQEDDSEDGTPQEKPKKKKQSIVSRIKAIFAKTEPVPVTFPATSFGKTVEAEMNEIISLSPLATEVILSSPSQNALIAVSDYCDKHGNDQLMTVGTPLIPDVEKIIQLKADCLIVQTPLTATDREKLEESGIVVLELDYPETVEELAEIYRSVTAITHGADIATFESERVFADVKEKLNLYTLALEGENKLNAVMLFNTHGIIATPDTMEGKLLGYFFDVKEMGRNYMAESMEAVAAQNPEVLIVADTITDEQIAAMGLGETSAAANGRVYRVDIQQFENLSLKSIKTLCGIANEVYGNIIQPPVIETEE